jgi:hypothetical protein
MDTGLQGYERFSAVSGIGKRNATPGKGVRRYDRKNISTTAESIEYTY